MQRGWQSLTNANLSKMITKSEMMLQASNKMHALGKIGQAGDVAKLFFTQSRQ